MYTIPYPFSALNLAKKDMRSVTITPTHLMPPQVVKINIGLPKAQKYLTGYPTKAAELEYSLLSECAHLRYKA